MELREQKSKEKQERMSKILDNYAHGKQAELARILSLPRSTVNVWYAKGSYNDELILNAFPDLSAEWLMRGNGKMLLGEVDGVQNNNQIKKALDLIAKQAETIEALHELLKTFTNNNK